MTQVPEDVVRPVGPDLVIDLDAPRLEARASGLRVAVVHDYLTQRGGAERVVLSMMEAFPGARLVTSVYNPETTFPEFAQYEVETTWLDGVGVFRNDPRRALPLLPFVFSGVQLDDVDLVVCSSSGWSHGVRTTAPKVVYCHNPARWLYQREDYVADHSALTRAAVGVLSPYLKSWDRHAAGTVSTYFANSRAVAGRIEQTYGIAAEVLAPPIAIDPLAEQTPVEGLEPGFLLTVSRARGYKNTTVVAEAVESLPHERLVVVGGLPEGRWSDRLVGATGVTDAQLRWLYANCSALVAASHEDFGLTPLEGNAFGKPAACLRAGGFLDTLEEGVSGVFIEELTAASVREALLRLRALALPSAPIVAHADGFRFPAFRDALVLTGEALALANGAAPADLAPVPHRDQVAAVRLALTLLSGLAVVLTVLTGHLAMTQHPWLLTVTAGLAVLAAGLLRLRFSLRGRAGRRRVRVITLP